ncbi:MAG: hypothetical protein IJX39_02965 [Clostridia bacterium]|nr:hypothetical protein [Clostridia bacterium]
MCEICEMSHCPPACPSYGRSSVTRCLLCGSVLDRGEQVWERDGRFLCTVCAAELDADALCYLAGVGDVSGLLREYLGWEVKVL